jgi:GTPase SAR1 family protein
VNSKLILRGPAGSGKTTILIERYRYLVENLKIPSEKILILLLNRHQAHEWSNKLIFKGSGAIWRTSYYGFIQGEIKTYYPIILKKYENILIREIKPVFATFEVVQFLVSKAIEGRRSKNGAFSGVTTLTEKIASELTSNLVKAAASDIPFDEIGQRLFNSLQNKDSDKKQLYQDIDLVSSAYRNKCIELGIFDMSMAIDLYNNCLLKDETYKTQLFKRVQHIIIDNIEECVPSEIDFIEFMLPNISSCLLAYNNESGIGELAGSNHGYIKSRLEHKCITVEINENFNCKDSMVEFSDMLFDNIDGFTKRKSKNKVDVERIPTTELRSEMLERVGDRVISLIANEGYKPCDIVILSTYADCVTELVIERILEKKGYKLKNIAKKSRVIDNTFSRALITLVELCHPGYGINPNRDDVKLLLCLILKIDPVRSSILASEICKQKAYAKFPDIEFNSLAEQIGIINVEKYEHIRNWIESYKNREQPIPMSEFLQRAFVEILISPDMSQTDIQHTKNLIEMAQAFIEVVSRFNNINVNKGFIEMVRGGIKSPESILEQEKGVSGEYVYLSTPSAYLSGTLKNKVTILTSISSNNWSPRIIKEMTNIQVLTKTWDINNIYTEEQEEMNQKHQLAVIMRAILKRCGDKLITFESNLSANGYENDGQLSIFFDDILN